MARLFTDGGEAGDILFFDATDGTVDASALQARTGNYSYRMQGNEGGQKTLASLTEFYLRFGVYIVSGNANPIFLRIRSGTTTIADMRRNDGTGRADFYVNNSLFASGAIPFPKDGWNRVEVHFVMADSPNGLVETRIEGISDISQTGDTKPGALTSVNNVQLFSSNSTIYFDDIALNDTTGGADNSWCGDGRIVALIPDGDGDASGWTPSAGTNYQCVDDVPPDGDTSYVEASLSGTQDLYTVSAFDGTDKTILRAWAECRARGTVGGEQITLTVKTGGTEYQSAARSLTASYARYVGTDYPTNPATSAAWTDGELDLVQVGQEVV